MNFSRVTKFHQHKIKVWKLKFLSSIHTWKSLFCKILFKAPHLDFSRIHSRECGQHFIRKVKKCWNGTAAKGTDLWPSRLGLRSELQHWPWTSAFLQVKAAENSLLPRLQWWFDKNESSVETHSQHIKRLRRPCYYQYQKFTDAQIAQATRIELYTWAHRRRMKRRLRCPFSKPAPPVQPALVLPFHIVVKGENYICLKSICFFITSRDQNLHEQQFLAAPN